MSGLPAGTVTFVFCDVEGSTRLLRALGEAWGTALADYRRILRETFGGAGGREVDSQGDGLFFVFARARAAVSSAAEAQRRLAAHSWPGGADVRVRMGLHTGEPGLGEEGYLGIDVVRAARIAAAGHGGQVLLSATTQALLAGDPLEGVGTIFLGEHALKDLPAAEPVHQLVIAGLQTRFEPLRTEAGGASEPVPIAGRELEVARGVEDVVRDLRTSIEQQVADSLRRLPSADAIAATRLQRARGALGLALVSVVVAGAVLALLIWLLVG